MNILIGGDVVPTDSTMALFNQGNVIDLLGESLYKKWTSSDIRLFNLEVPLTNYKKPILKKGPNLIAPTTTINGIKNLNPSLVSLANNHILDYGIDGLNSTETLLEDYHIPHVGTGCNIKEASKPYILKKDDVFIGVYACAEHEFTIATDEIAGANPFDPLESLDHIQELKEKCDYVIVLYHGGKEHYRYPSPYLQKVCRKMVEKGADLVVCQHSHCIGTYEQYKNSTIIYGQGNFIFNKLNNEFWNTSILINLKIEKELHIDFIPIVRTEKGIRLANEVESKQILLDLYSRSKRIQEQDFIENCYNELAESKINNYLRQFSGFGKWVSRFDRKILKGKLLQKKYKTNQLLSLQNFIECEAHRELILRGIKNRINKF